MTKNSNTLPQGWQIKTLGQIGSFSKGKGITKAEIVETGKPCIRYGQIYSEYNYFVEEFKSFINDESASNSERIYKNDLLFAGSGETLEDIGKCVAYIKDEEAYAGGDIIILRPNSEDAHYLGYLFNTDDFKRQTFKLGQGHSVVHIYSSSLKNVKVALPPLPEQQKIAKILATWEKAIALQQKLISNKKENQKAVMKKLLTGEVRFEGFDDEWKRVRLGEIGTIIMGQSPDSKSYNKTGNGVYLLQGNADITNRKSNPRIWTSLPSKMCDINDILMTVRAPVGAIAIAIHNACIGRGICTIKPLINSSFLYHILVYFESKWGKLEQGSIFSSISSTDIKLLKLRIPNDRKEQKKIASFLSRLDKEINALQNELIALRKQKQGLMQQLLTGKIRVKN
ncbi:MAG: restriction endonuclease subunit S [Bacteroidetes bacterium]|nr:restriction endonuclease subunit S [Bacteroidota bacterium]